MHATRELIVLRRLMYVVLSYGALPVRMIVRAQTSHAVESRYPQDVHIIEVSTFHRNDGEEMVPQDRSIVATVRPKVPGSN